MAKVHVALARTNARAETGSTLPVPDAVPSKAETIITAAASKVGTLRADAGAYSNGTWIVTAFGGPVWVAFGDAPEAAEGTGWLLMDGETRAFGAASGQRIAVRDAA